MNKIDLRKYNHLLFDYDGLLVDTENLYYQAWCTFLTEEGKLLCKDILEGRREDEVYELVKSYLLNDITLEMLSREKTVVFNELVYNGGLQMKPGIKELLETAYRKFPLSIVSNSTLDIVQDGLKSLGLDRYFINLFCFSHEIKAKPAPDLYNMAINTLDIPKKRLVAFEDSKSGVLAAINSGIDVICINSYEKIQRFCKNKGIHLYASAYDVQSQLEVDC